MIHRASSTCCTFSVLSFHQTFDGLSALVSQHPGYSVRLDDAVNCRHLGIPIRSVTRVLLRLNRTSSRPLLLIGTSGNGAYRRNQGVLQWFSCSTACPTSTAPHGWCTWRAVNGFSTGRSKNSWAAGERVRRCTTHAKYFLLRELNF